MATDRRRMTKGVIRPSSLVFGPLFDELAALLAWLREWQLWFVLALGLALWSLAYQVPYSYELNFGGDRATQRRHDDRPYIIGWNRAPEPTDNVWLTVEQPPFRWAFDDASLLLPGIGRGAWRVSILAAGQPTPWPTRSQWSDGTITSTVVLTREARVYQHAFTTDARGDLTLHFSTPPYTPPDDPRPLGFVGFTAVVRSLGPQAPPVQQLVWLALSLGAAYGLARRLGLARRWVAVGGALSALLLAVLLAWWRLPVTSFTSSLAPLVLGCYPLALVLARIPLPAQSVSIATVYTPASSLQPLASTVQRSAIVGLVVLAFALRLGGMLHPHLIFSDIGLNTNNLLAFTNGEVYQKESLPSEAGGGKQPYPPGQYILAVPLQLLLEPTRASVSLVLKVVNALLDSLVVGLLWYVLRRRGYGQMAGLFAAALYVLPPPTLKSFGVGEFANIAGQAMALPLLAALALVGERLRERRVFLITVVLMLLALLGHSGVTISVVLLLGYLGVSWIVGPRTYRLVMPLLEIGIAAATLLGLFFHSAFLDLFVSGQSSDVVVAALPDLSFGEKLANEMNRVFGEQPLKPVSVLVMSLGALGVAAMAGRQQRPNHAPGLWPLIVAWWGSAILSLGLLAVRDQTVRWDLFLYPALCLAAGPLLAAVWCRGRAGRLVVALALAFMLSRGLIFWVTLIADQYHV